METDNISKRFTFDETEYDHEAKSNRLYYYEKGDNKRKRPIEITNASEKQRILDMNRGKLR